VADFKSEWPTSSWNHRPTSNRNQWPTCSGIRNLLAKAGDGDFLQVLLLARESGLLKLGTVAIDGTKLDADASKIRSVRYDRAKALRAKLAADIAELTARAQAADAEAQPDRQALPAEIARRGALKAKLDAACARIETEAREQAAALPAYEANKAAYEARKSRRGRPPKPPEDAPPPERQSNLTNPDSALMRRSETQEHRQAYNAQAVVCVEGSQLILAANLAACASDAPGFAATVLVIEKTIRLPTVVLPDTGFASGPAVAALEARGIDSLVAIGHTQPHRPYDFRPPPAPMTARRMTEPWRLAMQANLETDDVKARYAKCKHNHLASLRAHRRKERWSTKDAWLDERHRWRSERFHCGAKSWHDLARAVRRGLQSMRTQAFPRRLFGEPQAVGRRARRIGGPACNHAVLRASTRRRCSDRSAALVGERRRSLQGAHWIGVFNCPRVHRMRNAIAHAGKTQHRIVSAWIATAIAQDGAPPAHAQWRTAVDELCPMVPRLDTLMDVAEADVLAYMDFFSEQHRAKVHSTNPIERLNGEMKRRTDVVGIFPNADAVVRLVGAILLDQCDEWAAHCAHYMTLETTAR